MEASFYLVLVSFTVLLLLLLLLIVVCATVASDHQQQVERQPGHVPHTSGLPGILWHTPLGGSV